MVKNGQLLIRKIAYRSPADAPFGAEVMSFRQLRAMAEPAWRAAPQRPEFHVLGIVEQGTGHHTADFERYRLQPGSVLWIRPGPGTPPQPHNDAFSLFRHAIERDFATNRQVSHYARQLGYSARTLSRATLAATGAGAKEFIDARVLLEAKRLLAHGDLTVMQCAHQLGFHDAANFSKFFEQRAGLTPGAFRKSARGSGAP